MIRTPFALDIAPGGLGGRQGERHVPIQVSNFHAVNNGREWTEQYLKVVSQTSSKHFWKWAIGKCCPTHLLKALHLRKRRFVLVLFCF